LTSVWEGRSNVVGIADSLQVVEAVAETATFLLLVQSQSSSEELFGEVIGKCWTQSLQTYLTTSTAIVGPALRAHTKLGTTLCQGWVQLDTACRTKPGSTIADLSDWFWRQEVPSIVLMNDVQNQQLTQFFQQIANESDRTADPHLFSTVLRQKFHLLLEPSKTKSNWVPSKDVYDLWNIILSIVPSAIIFSNSDEEESRDKFVMNRILTWMIRHTSSLSEQTNLQLALLDTTLFYNVSRSIDQSSASSQWCSILREVVAAQPDLQILIDCLVCLHKKGWDVPSVTASRSSSVFSDFCIQVAKTAVEEAALTHHHHSMDDDDSISQAIDEHDENYRKRLRFLQVCAGLDSNTISEHLVGKNVIEAWVDCSCPIDSHDGVIDGAEGNPVLDTLVAMVKSSATKFDDALLHRILIQVWRQGGILWNDQVLGWFFQRTMSYVLP
jgi:hypothetical protein